MRLTEPSQIKKGMTIYAVHATGTFTDITELTLLSDAYAYTVTFAHFSNVADINSTGTGMFHDKLFLHDFNCGRHYNTHGLFTTEQEAEQYVDDYQNGIIHIVEEKTDRVPSIKQNSLFED